MSTELVVAPLSRIRTAPQVRRHFDDASIAELAASIKENGLQQPLLCSQEGDGLLLIDGERRLRALRKLGRSETIILVERDPVSAGDAIARQLACNIQRAELSVLERGEAIQSLMRQSSLTAEQAAAKLGLSSATVSRTLSVLKLPEPLRKALASGELAADTAYMLARVDDPAKQSELAAEVTGKRLTRDGLARKLRRVRSTEATTDKGPSRVTAPLAGGRSITVAGRQLSWDSLVESLETLLARAKKAKGQGLSLATFVRTLKDQAIA